MSGPTYPIKNDVDILMPIDSIEVDADDPLSADMVYRMAEACHTYWEHLADDDISPNQAQTCPGHFHGRSDDSEHIDRVNNTHVGNWLLRSLFVASGGGLPQAIDWRTNSLAQVLVADGKYVYSLAAGADYAVKKTSVFIIQDCEKFVCPSVWVDNQWDDSVVLTATLAGNGVTVSAATPVAIPPDIPEPEEIEAGQTEWVNLIIDITDVAGMTGWCDFYFTMTIPAGFGTVVVHSADGWSEHWDSDQTGISYTNNVASTRTDY